MASNHSRRHLQVRGSKRVLTCSQLRQARCFSTCCAHTHTHTCASAQSKTGYRYCYRMVSAWSYALALSTVQASHCAGMCVRVCTCVRVSVCMCGCLCVCSYAHLWQSTVWPLTRFVIAYCAVCCGDVVFLLLSIKCKPKWQLSHSALVTQLYAYKRWTTELL